jgi:preprotein translocase subunit SecG
VRTKISLALLTFTVVLLGAAPAALASAGSGQGWYGETNDKAITNAMFITIAFFPTVIIIFSLIQWRLDKRKHARMDAAKRRAANADWRGGW